MEGNTQGGDGVLTPYDQTVEYDDARPFDEKARLFAGAAETGKMPVVPVSRQDGVARRGDSFVIAVQRGLWYDLTR